MHLRPFEFHDTESIIQLIDSIYNEYSFKICLEDAESDLTNIAEYFPAGTFMVLVDDQDVVHGTVAVSPCPDCEQVCWLKRLYLDLNLRGAGYAEQMLEWAYEQARSMERFRLELWSDVLFDRAHRFYEKHGFVHDGTIRRMTDADEPYYEKYFVKVFKRR